MDAARLLLEKLLPLDLENFYQDSVNRFSSSEEVEDV
jgi:hypothetical protein